MEHPRKFEEEAEILEEAEESPDEVHNTSVLSYPRTPTTLLEWLFLEDVSIRDSGKGREMWGVISASLGAMDPLVAKLEKLVQDPPRGCSSESFKDFLKDVTEMSSCLHKLSEVENPPLPAKCWMNEARDLSYRMEDYIDSLLFVQPADPSLVIGKTRTTRSFRKWFSHVKTTPKSLEWHEQVVTTLSEFKEYAQDAIQRHKVYVLPNSKIESTLSHRGVVSIGPMLSKSYEETADIVIDGQMNEFIISLANDGDKQLKVVSVLGPACLGKTTLVKVFYNKFGKLYDCQAFIRVSKNPDMKKLLHDILSQLRPQDPPKYHSELVLIDDIKKYLQNKRYLLIVDNVSVASVWSIIKHAFPKGNHGSRIITTTQAEEVALTCCCYQSDNVFEVKPLDDDHSRMLFFGRVFGSEGNCPDQFKEDSNEIVELCGGLPLATVSVASLLASQPVMTAELLRYIHESLGSCFSANSSSDRTRQALNLSFSYLPQNLKTCLLYLSMYPEGYTFCKDHLVNQWIAECFIGATEGQDMKKVAESYIDELINRRFIQPIRMNYYNEVLSFAVHAVVHDLIARKSAEEDFIVAIEYNQKNKEFFHKARRLSLFGNARYDKISENIKKSQVRSLNFTGILECMPTISEYKLLRVLDLQVSGYARFTDVVDLTGISELFQLRYLKIACNNHFIRLPTNGLQFLETMNIMNAKVLTSEWSPHLPQLLHLCLPFDQCLLDRIGIRGSNLQDLHLTVRRYGVENSTRAMCSLIGGHANLKSIVMALESTVKLPAYLSFGFLDDLAPPLLLQRFECLPDTGITFRQIPKWVGKLDNLSILKISVWEMLMDCVDILRGLRALYSLSLYVGKKTERIIFDKGGFSALKFLKLKFMSDIPLIKFEEDAMPNLWKLRLVFNATPEKNQYKGFRISIDRIPSLKEISAKFGGAAAAADVEHGLTLVSNHMSNPKLTTNNGLHATSSYYGDQSTTQKHQPDNILEEEPDESTRQKQRPDEIQVEVRDEYEKKQADNFPEEEPDKYDKTLDERADKSISRSPEASSDLHMFTLHELVSATRGWCDLDIDGLDSRLSGIGFYKGQLVGDIPQGLAGQDVVIRCLDSSYSERLTELEYLGTVRHPHLVKLLGICNRQKQTLLVYEYMGINLKETLFFANDQEEGIQMTLLPWLVRLRIAVEAAKGLAFLHEADKPIVHGNFKASNILLFEYTSTVKLCGFGLLRHPPQKYTMENDVYNFGVVLLELLTGQPWFDKNGRGPGKGLVRKLDIYHLDEDKLSSLMDQSLRGNYSFSAARSTAEIAFWCMKSKLKDRPRMRDVVDALEQLLNDDNSYNNLIPATSKRQLKQTKLLQYFTSSKVKVAKRLADGAMKRKGKNKHADDEVEEPQPNDALEELFSDDNCNNNNPNRAISKPQSEHTKCSPYFTNSKAKVVKRLVGGAVKQKGKNKHTDDEGKNLKQKMRASSPTLPAH